jgi:hypothetical protein
VVTFKFVGRLASGGAFDADATKAMADALDLAWTRASPQYHQREDHPVVRQMLAKYIIDAAAEGERDAQALSRRAVSRLFQQRADIRGLSLAPFCAGENYLKN